MTKTITVLFGGTFDPIHLGHTAVAADAAEKISAERLIFIPAKCSPLKIQTPAASDEDRLTMIKLAIAEHDRFAVSNYELAKPAPSYTLATVRHFQVELGSDTSVYWLLGSDAIDELAKWYKAAELIDECNLCAMFRAGFEPPDFAKFEGIWGRQRVEKLERNIIETPLVDINSTEIRRRLATGEDVSGMLHPAVAEYIRTRQLYQTRD